MRLPGAVVLTEESMFSHSGGFVTNSLIIQATPRVVV